MAGLVSVISVVLETTRPLALPVRPRAYADDLSSTTRATSLEQALGQLRRFHAVVRAFESTGA
eukprot:252918-Prorocentrum_lima.AAC.1